MTFSVVARGPDGVSFGVAVASKFLAVGSVVPAAEAAVGALATQSAADPGRETRQLGVVASVGDGASFSGVDCHAWAGGRTGDGYACQGNILTGPEVVDELERAWLATDANSPLAARLLAALAAGDAAGGDQRGRQSAAVLVVSPGGGYGGSDVAVDLRVDDDPAPVPKLGQLLSLHEPYFGRPDPAAALPVLGELADEVRRHLEVLGYPDLHSWMSVENYEERHVPGAIDPLVLNKLRAAAHT